MPYISAKDDRREKLRNGEPALTAGELNYQIFYYVKHNCISFMSCDRNIIEGFIEQFLGTKPNYQRYNDMAGALILCAKEIKRRQKKDFGEEFAQIARFYDDEIAKYEDEKIISNGDVE
jgi:ABC-type transporter MlaC component